ncbi:ASKHA domain-containing protein [Holophaga foetida]|uniref:ASKHA domain-containing protein n=1 Tax=Holophaga foetida TaxID=35839 RepID=UPI0002474678|nr:ASKHA domain-containing protein [Holophaga foetida]
MEKHLITFMPDNVSVAVREGTNLLAAAKQAGIDMSSPCGGRGTCGKCAVKVISGSYDSREDAHLSEDLKAQGLVLACKIKVRGPMTVEVPTQSRLTEHKVLLGSKRTRFTKENDFFATRKMNPICHRYCLRLDPPDLVDNQSDWDRLQNALRKQHGLKDATIAISCLQALPAAARLGNWDITVTVGTLLGVPKVLTVEPGHTTRPTYGLAVDIGTTTVVVALLDTATGRILDKAGTYNKQSVYGSDVISRIIYTDDHPEGLALLQKAVLDTLNELIDGLLAKNGIDPREIPVLVHGGNTVMTHLFLGIPATWLRLEPYAPAVTAPPVLRAKELELHINPDALVVTIPSVAAYVGGDITAGVLATQITRSEELTLFIDIGTNGELVLGNNDWLVTCACSAGPAFEGSGIACGMRAMEGAIDSLEIDRETLEAHCGTIGKIKPRGICGSGLICALSELKRAGIIDRAGKMLPHQNQRIRLGSEGMEYVLVWADESGSKQDIVITEGDIKNLLRAKGAILAGIRTMLNLVQLEMQDIARVYIAGGFGNYLNISDSVRIGLLPDLPREKFEYVGNSCIQGAMTVLLSQEGLAESLDLANRMTYLELSNGNQFMDEFISALFIPHTDLNLFPSLQTECPGSAQALRGEQEGDAERPTGAGGPPPSSQES